MHHSLIRIPIFWILLLLAIISPQFLRAATFGGFDYADNGTTITILKYTGYESSVSIPSIIDGKSVKTIGEKAFFTGRFMKSLTIPASVTTIGDHAFYLCEYLTQVTVVTGLQIIGDSAFYGCRSLASITLPDTVTQIGESAFADCRALTGITLPETVTRVGTGAFSGCLNLKSCEMPCNLKAISDGMFYYCPSLKNVMFPPNLQTVGAGAFYWCTSLTTTHLPKSVTTLGPEAFASSGLTEIVIPENVNSIGKKAFNQCLSLRNVVIDSNLGEIENEMFAGCRQLSQVKLPQSLNRIGALAFLECPLKKIDLKNVKQIDANAFRYCGLLTTVTIPKSVKGIGDGAFGKCGNLASAVFQGDAPRMGKAVFNNASPDFQIIVSDGSEHFTAPRWNGYRLSLPKAEIAVQLANGDRILNMLHSSKFGMVLKGKRSAPTVFTIRNVGNRKLKGLSARINGDDSQDFLIRIPMRNSLAPGNSTTIELVFKPKKAGKRQSTLQLMSSDADENPFEIHLSGIGLREL